MIESEDDARLHRDAARMKTPDDFAVFGRAVVALVGDVEAGLRNRFQAAPQLLHKNSYATRRCGYSQIV